MRQIKESYLLLIIFAITIVFSFNFLHSDGVVDFEIWMEWIDNVKNYGIIQGYEINNADYPPFSSAILYLVPLFSKVTGFTEPVSLKFFLFISLSITSLIFFFWSKNFLYAIISQVALILNAMALSYIDIFTGPFFLIALYALYKEKYLLFTFFYFINIMIKWQGIIMFPFILIYFADISSFRQLKNIEWKKLLLKLILPLLILLTIVLKIFHQEVFYAFDRAVNGEMLSGYALNLNWIITRIFHFFNPGGMTFEDGVMQIVTVDEIGVSFIPKILFTIFFILILIAFFIEEKNFITLLKYSLLGYLVYFTFNTGVHENHLFNACLLAIVISIYDPGYFRQAIGIILVFNINMFTFYGTFGYQPDIIKYFGAEISTILSLIIVIFFIAIFLPVIFSIKKKISSGISTG